MKKIALFSLMVCMCGIYAVPALAGSCGTRILSLDGNQKPGDDEFLYTSTQAQTQAKNDYDNDSKKKDNMTDGQYNLNPTSFVLECDKDQCDKLTTVYLPNGGIAENKKGKYFQCRFQAFDDVWESFGECADGLALRDLTAPFYVAQNNRVLKGNPSDYNVYSGGVFPCVCTGNKEVVVEGDKKYCRAKGTSKSQPKDTTKSQPKTQSKECPDGQERATKSISVIKVCSGDMCVAIVKGQCYNKEFLKCMEAADRGEPANWNGKSCNCGDKQIWDNKNYKCVKKAGTPTKTQKPQQTQVPGEEKTCTYSFKGSIECNGKKVVIEESKQVTVPCVEGIDILNLTEEMFKNDTGKLQQIRDELCDGESSEISEVVDKGTVETTHVVTNSDVDYSGAEATLKKFVEDAENKDNRSVWKNAEGKFNTTRLASDITAGVVLGTVGGVVTGVVIKKNQVKKGFEALHCTVGGQKVAEWGDEFSVGLQR